MCGVPAPIVRWRFNDGPIAVATRDAINFYTYQYLVQLPKLTQKSCGGELTLNASGIIVIERKICVFLEKCEC